MRPSADHAGAARLSLTRLTYRTSGVVTHTPVYDKVVSNLQEVKARDGRLIVICDEGDEEMKSFAGKKIISPTEVELQLQAVVGGTTLPVRLKLIDHEWKWDN